MPEYIINGKIVEAESAQDAVDNASDKKEEKKPKDKEGKK